MNIQDFFAGIVKEEKEDGVIKPSTIVERLGLLPKGTINNFDAWLNGKCTCSIEDLMREGCVCQEFKEKTSFVRNLILTEKTEIIAEEAEKIYQETKKNESCKQSNGAFLLKENINIDVIYPEDLSLTEDLWEKVNETIKAQYYTIVDVNLLKILEREIKNKTKRESCLLSFNETQEKITVDFLYKDKVIFPDKMAFPKVNAVVPSLITNKNILNLGEVVEDIVYKYVFELITEQTVKKISDEIREVVGEECKIFPQKRGLKIKFDKLNREFLIL